MSLDDETSSSAIRIHYPCLLQDLQDGGSRIMVTYSRFYLNQGMGLTSPDQVLLRNSLFLKPQDFQTVTIPHAFHLPRVLAFAFSGHRGHASEFRRGSFQPGGDIFPYGSE